MAILYLPRNILIEYDIQVIYFLLAEKLSKTNSHTVTEIINK
ncbi:hypothetical protein [Peribacillus butanolivorans]